VQGAGVNSAPFANSVGTYGQVSRTFHCGGDSRCAGCALRTEKLRAGRGKGTVVQRYLVASSRARACSGKVLLRDRLCGRFEYFRQFSNMFYGESTHRGCVVQIRETTESWTVPKFEFEATSAI
jgi:hypothetical protein